MLQFVLRLAGSTSTQVHVCRTFSRWRRSPFRVSASHYPLTEAPPPDSDSSPFKAPQLSGSMPEIQLHSGPIGPRNVNSPTENQKHGDGTGVTGHSEGAAPQGGEGAAWSSRGLWRPALPVPVEGWEFPAIQLRGSTTGCPVPHSCWMEWRV